ncbi:MAG: hypothetical protein WAV41_02315 [Microgenomates group bacterium]
MAVGVGGWHPGFGENEKRPESCVYCVKSGNVAPVLIGDFCKRVVIVSGNGIGAINDEYGVSVRKECEKSVGCDGVIQNAILDGPIDEDIVR